jgi:hypothetical protein
LYIGHCSMPLPVGRGVSCRAGIRLPYLFASVIFVRIT